MQEVRAIASLGDEEIKTLGNVIDRGPEGLSGLMRARTYREKVVKIFLNKICQLVGTIVARVKSCYRELMKIQQELNTVKKENAELQRECKELKFKQETQQERREEFYNKLGRICGEKCIYSRIEKQIGVSIVRVLY